MLRCALLAFADGAALGAELDRFATGGAALPEVAEQTEAGEPCEELRVLLSGRVDLLEKGRSGASCAPSTPP